MNHKFFFFLALTALVIGCQADGRQGTEGGYEYKVVKAGSKDPIALNSYVFYNMELAYGDSVMQNLQNKIKIEENPSDYGEFNALVRLLGKMHEGDSFLFYFPIDSFNRRPPGLENMTGNIEYRIGISDVMEESRFETWSDSMQVEEEKVRQAVRDRLPEVETMIQENYAAYKAGQLDGQMKSTESGLRYIVHEAGTGDVPARGDFVSVHYYGMLDADGKMFDNSFSRGTPIDFVIGAGQMIPGFDEGAALLNRGSKATLYIPYELGYGAAGNGNAIPEMANLIFYVELQDK